jgi:hypothetical protein
MDHRARTMLDRAVADLREISREIRCGSTDTDLDIRSQAAFRYCENALAAQGRRFVPPVAERVGLAAFGASGLGLTPPQFDPHR